MTTFKIIKQQLGQRVFEMRAQGLSLEEIARRLREEGYDVSKVNVWRFLRRYGDNIKAALDPEQVAEYYLDAAKQLVRLNEVLWQQARAALNNGDTLTFLRVTRALHDNIGLFLRQQGEISDHQVNVAVNLRAQQELEQEVRALVDFIYSRRDRYPGIVQDFHSFVRRFKRRKEEAVARSSVE